MTKQEKVFQVLEATGLNWTVNKKELVSVAPDSKGMANTRLRSRPKRLSEKDVREMLSRFNFFDKKMNRSDGFSNAYVKNPNGTVTDKSTGLMWQRGESFFTLTFKEAMDYINEINNRGLGGYHG